MLILRQVDDDPEPRQNFLLCESKVFKKREETVMNESNFIELKFTESDKPFKERYLKWLVEQDIDTLDFVHQFPLFSGFNNLARYLTFYDLYKQVYELAGDIADVGTYKGASFMMFTKLVKLFEPYTYTQVHAYDWFEGMAPTTEDDKRHAGEYVGDYEMLRKLLELQELSDIGKIHKLDLTKSLPEHFEQYSYLRFKLCFIDCGIKEVLEESLKHFWPRVVNGGIVILDHYNLPVSPYECDVIEKYTNCKIQQCAYTRQPTGYVVKKSGSS